MHEGLKILLHKANIIDELEITMPRCAALQEKQISGRVLHPLAADCCPAGACFPPPSQHTSAHTSCAFPAFPGCLPGLPGLPCPTCLPAPPFCSWLRERFTQHQEQRWYPDYIHILRVDPDRCEDVGAVSRGGRQTAQTAQTGAWRDVQVG